MNAIRTLVLLTQIGAAKAQRHEIDTWQLLILYVLAAIGVVAVWWKMCQLSWQVGEWMFPQEPAEPTPPQGAEVQLQLQGSQVQLRVRPGLAMERNWQSELLIRQLPRQWKPRGRQE